MSAQDEQVGGDHYKKRSIQPWDIVEAYPEMDPLTFIIIRYMLRWPDKNGLEDLRKARHTLDKLIEIRTERRTHGERMADELREKLKEREIVDTWGPAHRQF